MFHKNYQFVKKGGTTKSKLITIKDWEKELLSALSLGTKHMSLYQLTIEDGTVFGDRAKIGKLPGLPSEDLSADMYTLTQEIMSNNRLPLYEVSNHAFPGEESHHNLIYWRGGDFIGIGPGAHSHIGGVRWWNVKHPAAYAARMDAGLSPAKAREILSTQQHSMEKILLGLRMREGIPTSLIGAGHREDLAAWVGRGYLQGEDLLAGHIVLTQSGRLVADYLATQLT